MKIKIAAILMVITSLSASAQTFSVYADVFPVTESRLTITGSNRNIEDTAANSVGSVSFASMLVLPTGVTSVTFNSATFTVTKQINGTPSTSLSGTSMALSKFNDETSGNGTPNIFGRTSTGTIVAPTALNLVGNAVGIKTLLITDHVITLGGSFPKMVVAGDYYRLSRTLTGNYIIGGVSTPFSVTGESSVTVVNETDFPVNGVSVDYPNDPKITSAGTSGGSFVITATGLTVDSYMKTWWVETSTDLGVWVPAVNGTVGPNVTITFPIISGDSRRFWRINGLTQDSGTLPPL